MPDWAGENLPQSGNPVQGQSSYTNNNNSGRSSKVENTSPAQQRPIPAVNSRGIPSGGLRTGQSSHTPTAFRLALELSTAAGFLYTWLGHVAHTPPHQEGHTDTCWTVGQTTGAVEGRGSLTSHCRRDARHTGITLVGSPRLAGWLAGWQQGSGCCYVVTL